MGGTPLPLNPLHTYRKIQKPSTPKKIQFFETPSHPQKKFTKFHLYCRKPDKLPPVTMKEVMTKPEWVSLYLPEPLDNSIYSQLQETVTNVNSTVRSQILCINLYTWNMNMEKYLSNLMCAGLLLFRLLLGFSLFPFFSSIYTQLCACKK